MPDHSKSEIQNALLAAVGPLLSEGGGYVRRAAIYKGELNAPGLWSESQQLPAIFFSYTGSTYASGSYQTATETLSFNVIAVTRPGAAWKLQQDIRRILCGSLLGLGINPARLSREFPLIEDTRAQAVCAVYSITQSVSLPSQE